MSTSRFHYPQTPQRDFLNLPTNSPVNLAAGMLEMVLLVLKSSLGRMIRI
jgi:hypothetical protein